MELREKLKSDEYAEGCVDAADVMTLELQEEPQGECTIIIRGSVSGLKCTRISTFLRELAWIENIEIKLEEYKGWLRETVLYELKGPESVVRRVQKTIDTSVEEWNRDE